MRYLKHETDIWLEITNLLIPGLNDSEDEITSLCEWIVAELGPNVPIHFSAFHPDYKMRDRPSTPASCLMNARKIAGAVGLNYAYTGNIFNPEGDASYCCSCQSKVIGRNGYEINYWGLDALGCCKECGNECHGVFDEFPGSWGRRRQVISV